MRFYTIFKPLYDTVTSFEKSYDSRRSIGRNADGIDVLNILNIVHSKYLFFQWESMISIGRKKKYSHPSDNGHNHVH